MRRPASALLIAGALLAGCGGPTEEEKVRDVVTAFGQATAAKDYHRLCDRILAPQLIAGVQSIGLPCEVALQQSLGEVKDPRLIIGRITVKDERASAEVRTSAANQQPSRNTLQLVKVRGQWRIASLGK